MSECIVLLPFQSLYYDCSLCGGDCPESPVDFTWCLCMNQWYMTTVFLTIVFVGARYVFNNRDGDNTCILGFRKGFVLKNNDYQQ